MKQGHEQKEIGNAPDSHQRPFLQLPIFCDSHDTAKDVYLRNLIPGNECIPFPLSPTEKVFETFREGKGGLRDALFPQEEGEEECDTVRWKCVKLARYTISAGERAPAFCACEESGTDKLLHRFRLVNGTATFQGEEEKVPGEGIFPAKNGGMKLVRAVYRKEEG